MAKTVYIDTRKDVSKPTKQPTRKEIETAQQEILRMFGGLPPLTRRS